MFDCQELVALREFPDDLIGRMPPFGQVVSSSPQVWGNGLAQPPDHYTGVAQRN